MPTLHKVKHRALWGQSSHLTDPDRDDQPRHVYRADKPASVYFIRWEDLVRIGTTIGSPRAVTATMRAPEGSELVAVIPYAGEQRERQIHEMFAASRLNGKWFRCTPELDALIGAFAI